MRIAIIGAGNVGGALARGWVDAGHDVVFGVRDPSKESLVALVGDLGDKASAAGVGDAANGADVVVLATPWDATKAAIEAAGDLSGKIVVDCTNPLTADLSTLTVGTDRSAGEEVAEWLPDARVVKAFNTTGSGNMEDPKYGEDAVTMFICGDDAEAKGVVTELAETLGFEVCDAGGIDMARWLEPTAMLWIKLAYQQGMGPNFGFRLVRR